MEVNMTYEEYIPERKEKGKYSYAIEDFLKSDKKTLIFSCTNPVELRKCAAAVRRYNRVKSLGLCIWSKGNQVYVIKG